MAIPYLETNSPLTYKAPKEVNVFSCQTTKSRINIDIKRHFQYQWIRLVCKQNIQCHVHVKCMLTAEIRTPGNLTANQPKGGGAVIIK